MNTSPENNLQSLVKANTILGLDNIKENKIIIVYCPPRVGSTSLVSSLRLSGSHIYKVLHIHDEEMLKIVGKIKDVTVMDIINYNAKLGRELFIFDIYRDPIERKMSEFFGKLASFHFNAEISEIENYCMERLSKRFNNIFPFIGEEDHFLEKYTPISKDIPDNFDFTNKVLHIQKENIHFLKIRLRDYENWHKILSPILKINITKIIDNKRDTLELKDLYNMFKKEYKIPLNLFEHVTKHPSFHFYLSADESNNYIKKYSNNVCEDFIPFTNEEYKAYKFISSENQKNIDIESDHYFDEGCQCDFCQQVRGLTIVRLGKGLPPKHKILHRFCYKKVSLLPKIEIKPYIEETFPDEAVNSQDSNDDTEEQINLTQYSTKINIEDLLAKAKKMSDEQNEKEAKLQNETKKYIINNNEHTSDYEFDISKIEEPNNESNELDLNVYTALHNIKLQKQKRENDRKIEKVNAVKIRNDEKEKIQKEINEKTEEFKKQEQEQKEQQEEEDYKIKINKLRIKSIENFKKAQEDNIREEREQQINKRKEIESMSFKDKATSIKNKLIDEIYGRTNSGPSVLNPDNLKKNSFISEIKLKPPPKTSLFESIQSSSVNEYANQTQPPPIPRETLSNNTDSSNPSSLQQTPRRIYKRSDGTFVYFKKEKDSNVIRMIPTEPPFQNKSNTNQDQNYSTSTS